MVKITVFETDPPGLEAVIPAVPAVCRKSAALFASSCVGLIYVTESRSNAVIAGPHNGRPGEKAGAR